jgi:SAM-dependent methyltransferase
VSKRDDDSQADMEVGMTTAERRRRRRRGGGLRVPSDNVPRRTATPPVVAPVPEDPALAMSIAYSFTSDASEPVRVDGKGNARKGDALPPIEAPDAMPTLIEPPSPIEEANFEMKTREMTAVDLEALGLAGDPGTTLTTMPMQRVSSPGIDESLVTNVAMARVSTDEVVETTLDTDNEDAANDSVPVAVPKDTPSVSTRPRLATVALSDDDLEEVMEAAKQIASEPRHAPKPSVPPGITTVVTARPPPSTPPPIANKEPARPPAPPPEPVRTTKPPEFSRVQTPVAKPISEEPMSVPEIDINELAERASAESGEIEIYELAERASAESGEIEINVEDEDSKQNVLTSAKREPARPSQQPPFDGERRRSASQPPPVAAAAAPPAAPKSEPPPAPPVAAKHPPAPPPAPRSKSQDLPEAAKPVPPKAPPPPAVAAVAQQRTEARERPRGKPWFVELFDEDYLRTLPFLTPQATQAEAEFVIEAMSLSPGAQVLDVGCGYGRHAMELAARGFHVVGLDLSTPLLVRGGEEAHRRGLTINFVRGDMRELDFEAQFDGAYCLFSTFGYFDDETNKKTAANIARALKPGGKILIEILNRDYVISDLPTRVWWEGDGCVVLEEVELNYFSSRIQVNRSVVFDDGRQLEQEISVRAYSLHEVGKLMHAAGFRVLEVSGAYQTRGRFFGNQSRHIIVLAERKDNQST